MLNAGRWGLAIVASIGAVGLVEVGARLGVVGVPDMADLVEYWAAGVVFLAGDSPYDPVALLAAERAGGWTDAEPLIMYNPPWTLPWVLPLAALHPAAARLAWALFGVGAIGFAAERTWVAAGGDPQDAPIAVTWALLFSPSILCLSLGQIGPLVLLGLVGWVGATRAGRPLLAGAALSIAAVKPHLLALVWVLVAVRALAARSFVEPLALASALAAALGAVVAARPTLVREFLSVVQAHGPEVWKTPTLGGLLRIWLGEEHFGLQFAPVALAVPPFAAWVWARRDRPVEALLAPTLLASVVTAAYGWTFDQVVLVIPAVVAAARLRRYGAVALGAWGTLNIALILLRVVFPLDHLWAWLAPLWAALWWWTSRDGADR